MYLLACVKRAKSLHSVTSADVCLKPLSSLSHSFIFDFFLRSAALLSFSFWHCSFFPYNCCGTNSEFLVRSFFRRYLMRAREEQQRRSRKWMIHDVRE